MDIKIRTELVRLLKNLNTLVEVAIEKIKESK